MNRMERTHADSLVDAAERLLLGATDEEILASAGTQASVAASEIQALVRTNLDAANAALVKDPSPTLREVRRTSAGSKRQASVLVSFLRSLAATRPDLSPRLQAVFRSSERPQRLEVEKLAVELLREHLEGKK